MTHVTTRSSSTLALAALLVACGDNGGGASGPVRCGIGTVEIDGECVVRDTGTSSEDSSDDDALDATEDLVRDIGVDTPEPDAAADIDDGPCADGATRCGPDGVPETCVAGVWTDATACDPGDICLAGRCVDGIDCTPGQVRGCFSETEQAVCDTDGAEYVARACADGLFCFDGECGTQRCRPGDRTCDDDAYTILECDASGENWVEAEICDRRASRVCANGECVSGCIAAVKDPSYVGCEYWSVDLPQYDDPTTAGPEIPHAVVLANVGEFAAEVTFDTRGDAVAPDAVTVPPGESVAVQFPRLDVSGTAQTQNSFRIQTTEPIVAYQFNPLNNVNLFSNDASLMLPISAIDDDYYVMSWPGGASLAGFGFPAQRAFFTVVATSAGTTRVQITFSTDVVSQAPITGITAGTTRVFNMDQYDVLNFSCESALTFPVRECDFTGTRVTGDRPVVVYAGHEQAVIGEDGEDGSNCCADHLEEQLFPVSAWGTRYLAAHSPPRGSEPDYWKVLASEDGTRIVTNPSIAGLDGVTLNAGEFVSINTPLSFEIEATAPVLVGQFLASQQSAGVDRYTGDPSFILAVPVEQFRIDYQMLVPANYDADYITVIRPVGAVIEVNGTPASAVWTRIGAGEFEFAHLPVSAGNYRLIAPGALPFGVLGYGYDSAVSYGYPGGLNLIGAGLDADDPTVP